MLFNVTPFLDVRIQFVIIFTILLSYFIKRQIFSSKKLSGKWENPFSHDSRSSVTPLVIEHEKRNQILKKAFTKQLATAQKWDAIVIGSGIGGLCSAAILSKAGLKVLVLEKHSTCGGACHTFTEEGYEFDVGIHYVGGFTRQTITHTLLDQISDGQIQWAQLEHNYDRVIFDAMSPTQREYKTPSGVGVWKKQLIERFPDERKAIENFFSMVNRMKNSYKDFIMVKLLPVWVFNLISLFGLSRFFSHYFTLSGSTLKDVIESLTKNKDLQLLLTYSWGTYGEPPYRTSFAMQALIHFHYEEGASYPIGGASEIPYRIVPVIDRAGGQVLMKAFVSQILTKDGKVTGVRVGNKANSAVDIYAPIVISDAGIHNTFLDLLPENIAKTSPIWPLTSKMKPGVGCLSAFIGLRGTAEELGLKAENLWIFTESFGSKILSSDIFDSTLDEVLDKPYPELFLGFPSTKDPSWESRYPGRSTIAVVSLVKYSWFAQWKDSRFKKRSDEYNRLKNTIGQQIIDQITHLYPNLKNAIDYFSIGTPVTTEHYLNTKEGAIYGLEHGLERFTPKNASLLRPETGIEGLFLCGQDVMSAGLVPAMLSGVLCTSAILNTNLFNDLFVLHKKVKMSSKD
uniref:All-trans-retinol 13,14-reductase n=1 Tax=Daphnia galeata TaxID=27404 RepID=A0A8J2RFE3_9CRUS|nr:unnamed protein product [Daphnia galeata]